MAKKSGKKQNLDYNPSEIEAKWQKKWEKERVFSPDLDSPARLAKAPAERAGERQPYYNLMMFPYPSAEGLHVGNMYAFTGADVWGRFIRMQGYNVFEPIGLDGFGIHSENYAIKIGEHPAELAKKTEKRFYEQLHVTGNAYDWERILETYDTDYYRWTQWIFVQMFKHGLAYRQKAEVNWCPSCRTVLADEQVAGGHCERCNSIAEKKGLEQWFFRITDYADRLLDNLDKIDWTPKVKIAQRNWIGRSEGAIIKFSIFPGLAKRSGAGNFQFSIEVFTTRPDTLHGATFLVLSPESVWVERVTTEEHKESVSGYIKIKQRTASNMQKEEKEKTGVFTGAYAINPVTGKEIPIWIADYVLAGYGSGAVMGVPAHDQRDFEFATKHRLPIVFVVQPKGELVTDEAYTGAGTLMNSGEWDGWQVPGDISKVIDWLEEKGIGKRQVQYHLRDWLISRQRYWGPPIPMIYCETCAKSDKGEKENMYGWYTVPESDLPVELPYIENYQPKGIRSAGSGQAGESPLAQNKEWVQVACPECGAAGRRETDVSDTFLDSAWYFLRYLATDYDNTPFPSKKFEEDQKIRNSKFEIRNSAQRASWLPVDMYIGGAEHSVLHLMYVRFVTMALHDWGYLSFEEPFPRFYAHGLLIKDGAKMSKSKGNVIIPDEYIKKYGADTLRAYLMFLGPFDQGGDFRDTGIEGMNRFMNRIWRLVSDTRDLVLVQEVDSRGVYRMIHKTIRRVTEDMNNLRYNRAIAGIMEFVNFLREKKEGEVKKAQGNIRCAEWDEALRTLLLLLAPFAPHMTEELWQKLGIRQQALGNGEGKKTSAYSLVPSASIHFHPWPTYNPELAEEEIIEIPVQVNGRLRGTVQVDRSEAGKQDVVEAKAHELESVARYLDGKVVRKVIFVPSRLINFVT